MSADTQVKAVAGEGVTGGERWQLEPGRATRGSASSLAATVAIARRELASMFHSPIAYVVGFIFLLLTGYSFVTETLVPGSEASMRSLLERMASLLVFALPLLTMRSIADEFSIGSIETLMTAPVSDACVVLGKFFGLLVFYLVLLAATGLHLVLMALHSNPVGAVVFSGYLGMVLLGSLFLAVGIFASSCTRHQLLAAVISVSVLAGLTFVVDYGAEYANTLRQRSVCAYLNVFGHFSEFAKGTVDSGSLIFFLSGTVFFLFLGTKVMESRRWR